MNKGRILAKKLERTKAGEVPKAWVDLDKVPYQTFCPECKKEIRDNNLGAIGGIFICPHCGAKIELG